MIFEIIILSLLCFLVARNNTMYHPHLLIKKHLTVKNKNIAKIFVCQRDMYNRRGGGRLIPKANRNKMLIPGLVFYILTVVAFMFSIVMVLIPNDDLIYQEAPLNIYLYELAFYILLSTELAFEFINSFKRADEIKNNGGAILMRVISVIAICLFFAGIVLFSTLFLRALCGARG